MSERIPSLEEQRLTIGLEAAFAANDAINELKVGDAKAEALATVLDLKIEGVNVDASLAEMKLDEEYGKTSARFNMFLDAAGALIGPDTVNSDSLFSTGNEAKGLPHFELALEEHLPAFLNPEVDFAPSYQLEVMGEFWNTLGFKVPELSDEQKTSIEQELAEHPDRRVIPTPLLHLEARKALVQASRDEFAKNEFAQTGDPLWTSDKGWIYGELLADPETDVKVGSTTYGMRYKTVTGGIVKRAEYIDNLKAAGQAIVDEEGTIWAFPVMDVRVKSPRNSTSLAARSLYSEVRPTATPESLIAMQLLHQANGTPNPDWEVDFANEAVYELKKNGDLKGLVSVAGVRWLPGERRVRLHDWDADSQNGYFGVRAGESGIKA
ncbi:MAG: hypothetical protein WDN66_05075 [Candidatus Saccharibacteria bacterium]